MHSLKMLNKLNRRPLPPSRDDALHMAKREWERLLGDWRSQLRDLHSEYGEPDGWVEAAVTELDNFLDSEAIH